MTMLPCRQCHEMRPKDEVLTRFKAYGKDRWRFKMCLECRRLAKKVYRKRAKEKNLAKV